MTTSERTQNELRTQREQTVLEHMAAECRHDVQATLATFADANYNVVPFGAPSNGAAAVDELLHQLFAAFPDFQAEALSVHHGDGIVRYACIFHFDADRLTRETVFFDHATLLAQIGVGG